MKVYIVEATDTNVYRIVGVYATEAQAVNAMKGSGYSLASIVSFDVEQPPTWTVWSKPNSAEARSAALNEDHPGDFKVRFQPSGGYIVNVSACNIRDALDVGEDAFRMHQISNQQEKK